MSVNGLNLLPLNPYAGGGKFDHHEMMHTNSEKWLRPWHMGTHLRVLSEVFLLYRMRIKLSLAKPHFNLLKDPTIEYIWTNTVFTSQLLLRLLSLCIQQPEALVPRNNLRPAMFSLKNQTLESMHTLERVLANPLMTQRGSIIHE